MVMKLGFSTPNQATLTLLPKNVYNDPVINPKTQVLKKAYFMRDLGPANSIYAKYWEQLKIGA
jgi:hypothetical protein